MRESIGGTWLFGIVITFIALFSAFLSYAISYTKAFNMKSEILNLIERAEGWTPTELDLDNVTEEALKKDNSVEAQAFALVKANGYNYRAVENIDCGSVEGHLSGPIKKGGYCVTKYCANKDIKYNDDGTYEIDPDSVSTKTYYKVTTFIALKIPVVNVSVKIPISGETRTLFYDVGQVSSDNECIKPN